jgi:hypothetical protein
MLVQLLELKASHDPTWRIKCIEETTTPEGEIVAINGIPSAAACGTEVAEIFVIEIRTNVLIKLYLVSKIL